MKVTEKMETRNYEKKKNRTKNRETIENILKPQYKWEKLF